MPSRPTYDPDQRRAPRSTVSWRARILRSNGAIIDCRAIDSSVGGLGLISQIPVVVEEHVRVALQMPDERTGALQVVVHDGVVTAAVLTPNGYRIGHRLTDPLQDLLDEIPPNF